MKRKAGALISAAPIDLSRPGDPVRRLESCQCRKNAVRAALTRETVADTNPYWVTIDLNLQLTA